MRRSDLVTITEAARMCGRTVWTIRHWANDGYAPTGKRLQVFRDRATNRRLFVRSEIEAVSASLLVPA